MGRLKTCPTCNTVHDKRGKYCSYVCGLPAVEDAIKQLTEKKGPIYDKWKERLKASIERI